MQELIKQIKEKGFKPMKFAIFNYMDDNGYITEMEGIFKRKFAISDFEYLYFDLEVNEKNGLKYRTHNILQRFYDLQNLVEVKIQSNKELPMVKLFILKDEGQVFLVKLLDFNLIELI